MARTGAACFERDLDQAALGWKARPRLRLRYGTHHPLRADYALAGDELEQSHAGGLLEDAGKLADKEYNVLVKEDRICGLLKADYDTGTCPCQDQAGYGHLLP